MGRDDDDSARHGKMQDTSLGRIQRAEEKVAKAGGHNSRARLVREDIKASKASRKGK